MTGPGSSPRRPRLDDLIQAERDIVARLEDERVPVDFEALSVVSNIYRAAAAIRRHMEQTVLRREKLSWTAFVVLWVLWIWGEMEARHLAGEAGVAKATLTGVLDTLERRGLVARAGRPEDRRLVVVGLTDDGRSLIGRVYPEFNRQERQLVAAMTPEQRSAAAAGLRRVVDTLSNGEADAGDRGADRTVG